jgi:hypothetical protein
MEDLFLYKRMNFAKTTFRSLLHLSLSNKYILQNLDSNPFLIFEKFWKLIDLLELEV